MPLFFTGTKYTIVITLGIRG